MSALAAPAFRSSRALAPVHQAQIVMVSPNNGLCQMICVALQGDDPAAVDVLRLPLADVAADGAMLDGYATVVFECHPNDAVEMAALRQLTARATRGTRFLAVTSEMLSLSAAKQLMEAGVEEVLPLDTVKPRLDRFVDLAEDARPAHRAAKVQSASPHRGAVIAVARARGGVGATTVAVNLATGLAGQPSGGRVALLDLDLQHGDAGFCLGIEDQGALTGMIRAGVIPDSTFLRTAVTDHASGLCVLPAPKEMAPLTVLTTELVSGLLDALQRDFDHIVIDLPQAVLEWLSPVLMRAEKVLMVTDTSVPAIRQTMRLIAAYAEDRPDLPVEIVVTGEAKPYLPTAAHKAAAKALERPLAHWIPRDAVAARRAIDRGVPLADAAPRSPATKALRQLVARVLQDLAPAARKTA